MLELDAAFGAIWSPGFFQATDFLPCPKLFATRATIASKANTSRPAQIRSGFHLPANLAGFVLGTVDIHIQIAGLETCILIIREPGARGNGPRAIGGFGECDNGWAALAWCTHMNVRHCAVDTGGFNGAADGFVRSNRDRACPRR
jgi:hypothetical protein